MAVSGVDWQNTVDFSVGREVLQMFLVGVKFRCTLQQYTMAEWETMINTSFTGTLAVLYTTKALYRQLCGLCDNMYMNTYTGKNVGCLLPLWNLTSAPPSTSFLRYVCMHITLYYITHWGRERRSASLRNYYVIYWPRKKLK